MTDRNSAPIVTMVTMVAPQTMAHTEGERSGASALLALCHPVTSDRMTSRSLASVGAEQIDHVRTAAVRTAAKRFADLTCSVCAGAMS